MIDEIQKEIRSLADPKRAKTFAWFFKTGPGQYGEGDKFLGLNTPQMRRISRKHFQTVSLADLDKLIRSPYHEERSIVIQMLVHKFAQIRCRERQQIYDFYLSHTKWINNWDLVDISAPKIVGEYLLNKPTGILIKLAKSPSLWERRIAIISTFAFIYQGQPDLTLKISKLLLTDKHDLIHKAVGWALREVGKRCGEKYLTDFLDKNVKRMPRTALRYAIERFSDTQRKHYLSA
jgi:3-methyladenine DNA glycosylase AlkD